MQPQFRRHKDGGLVQDFTEIGQSVQIFRGSALGEGARAMGEVVIRGSSLVAGRAIITDKVVIANSQILGYAIVTGGPVIEDSLIDQHALITGEALISDSTVSGTAQVHGFASITGSIIDGNAVVRDSAVVLNSHIHGNVEVLETAGVEGIALERNERVHEGRWTRAPRHMSSPAATMAMTECIDGKVIIGCVCRHVDWWKKHDKMMQRKFGWSDEAVKWVWDNIDEVAYDGAIDALVAHKLAEASRGSAANGAEEAN